MWFSRCLSGWLNQFWVDILNVAKYDVAWMLGNRKGEADMK